MAESPSQPPTEGSPSAFDLVRHLQEDQRSRWLRDDRVRIETYLEQFPTLRTQADTVVELVKSEFELRLANGEQPAVDEYVRSFPEYETELLQQFRTALDSTPPSQCEFEAWVLQSPEPTGVDVITGSLSPDFTSQIGNGSPLGATLSAGARIPDGGRIDPHKATLGTADEPVAYTGLRIGVYDVKAEIGRGGMGVVYKAHDARLHRLVALKMIRAGTHASQEETLRFLAEAEAVAQVQHPNIVQIYEINRHGNQPFIAFEFVDGVSLHRKLKNTPMPAAEAAVLLEILARAIHVVHQHGIVHRDLKPANVLLTNEGQLKITDFGLAKRIEGEEHLTQTGAILGTPSYMSPEQADGKYKEVGPASDIYALGAILYELLTGRPPFRGETSFDTIQQVRADEPVPPSRLRPKVPADLETICLKCLNKQPAKRYASAEALAQDLHRFTSGEPIVARPVSVWERVIKWARRRPAAAALATISLIAVLCLVGGSVAYGLYLHERGSKQLGIQRRYYETLTQTENLLGQAEAALERGDEGLRDAETAANTALEYLASSSVAEFRLYDIDSFDSLQRSAERLRAEAKKRRSQLSDRRQFAKLHDEVLFQGSRLLEADLLPDRNSIADKAMQALSLYHVHPENGDRILFDPDWTDSPRQELTDRCYEILLILAETEFLRKDAVGALRILDRAARLDVQPTCAFHIRRAAYLKNLGLDVEAQTESAAAEWKAPQSSLDHFLVGMQEYSLGRHDGAERAFEKALGMQADHFWAQYYLSLCHLRRHSADTARMGLTHCVAQRSDFVWGYLLRGFANGQLGRFALAREDFDRARRANDANGLGSGQQALYSILLNRGTLAFREQSANDPARAICALHPLFVVGLAPIGVVQHSKLNEALENFELAARLDPKCYHAFSHMAKAYQAREDWVQAEQCNKQAIEVARAAIAAGRVDAFIIADLLSNRSEDRVRANQPEAALRDLHESIRLRIGDSEAVRAARAKDHAARGLILYRLKNSKHALDAFETSLKEQPGLMVAMRGRAYAMFEVEGLSAETHQAISACIQREVEDADLFLMRGKIEFEKERYEHALDDITRAIKIRPSSIAYARRGWTRVGMQSFRMALEDFDSAVQLDASNSDAHSGRGLAAALFPDHDRAIEDAREAVRLRPNDDHALLNAARVYSILSGSAALVNRGRPNPIDPEDYQRLAVKLLRQALGHVDADKHRQYWNDFVEPDPFFRPIRNHPDFERLRSHFMRTVGQK